MRQQKHAWKNHGPKWIDMLQGVEADPAELPGGVIAQPVGHKGVRGLVEGDGDQDREHPDRYVI
jgi:hypothetical protein